MIKIFYKIVILLLLSIIFLFSFNLLLSHYARMGKYGYQLTVSHKVLGFYHNPDLQFYDKYYKGFVKINRRGFRNENLIDSTYHNAIFLFGDSMLDLLYANKVLPNYLLKKKYKKNFINTACISFSNIQEYLLLKLLYKKYHFKKAMFFIYDGNDPIDNIHNSQYMPAIVNNGKHFYIRLPKKFKKQNILWYSILYSFYFAKKFNKIEKNRDYWNKQMFGYVYDMRHQTNEMFLKNKYVLNLLVKFAKENHIKITFYIIPNITEIPQEQTHEIINNWEKNGINIKKTATYFKKIRNMISAFLTENKIQCIDLTVPIKKLSKGNFYHKTNYHLTPEAFKILIDENIITP